jgi:hypothetical protein
MTERGFDFILSRGSASDLAEPSNLLGGARAEHRGELHVHLRLPLDTRHVCARITGPAWNDILVFYGEQIIRMMGASYKPFQKNSQKLV